MMDSVSPVPSTGPAGKGRPALPNSRLWTIATALFLALALAAPKNGSGFDLSCWVSWSKAIVQNGLAHAYAVPTCNYPPGALALLGGLWRLLPGGTSLTIQIKAIKALWLAFDATAIGLAMAFLKSRGRNPYLALVLLNPAFLFNSFIWGQCDGSIALFATAASYAAVRRRPALAAFLVSCGLAVKMQEIVFVPFVAFLAWPSMRTSASRFVTTLGAGLAPWIVLLVPFARAGTVGSMVSSLAGNGGIYPYCSMNAFNPWYIVSFGSWRSDSVHVMGFSLKTWGLLAFGVAVLAILALTGAGDGADDVPSDARLARVATAGGLIAMAFFLFNTEMHERYLHPAMLFFAGAAFLTGRWRAFVTVSAGVLLNEAFVYFSFSKTVSENPGRFHWLFDRTYWIGSVVAVTLCIVFALELAWLVKTRTIPAHADPSTP